MSDPFWDERYGVPHYVFGTQPNEFLAAHVGDLPPGGLVLSLGEGEGRNGTFLAARGFRVVAIDGSAVGADKARRLAAERGVGLDYRVGDLSRAPLPPTLDAAVSIFCHMPSQLRRAVHRRVEAALRPGGVLLAELYRPAQLALATGGPKDVDLLPTLADLLADFPGCDVVHGAELERVVVEGPRHTGLAAVVQVILRKR
jgi:SAM-dependent methyltransferase